MSGEQLAFDPEAEMPVGAPGAILAIVSGPSGVSRTFPRCGSAW